MSNIAKFEELLRSDEDLQAKLRAATEAFDGDKSDEKAVFEAVLAPLAAEVGLGFTYDELAEYGADARELSNAELESVAGGYSGCVIIGGGALDDPDACIKDFFGAGTCHYLGIGLLHWH